MSSVRPQEISNVSYVFVSYCNIVKLKLLSFTIIFQRNMEIWEGCLCPLVRDNVASITEYVL